MAPVADESLFMAAGRVAVADMEEATETETDIGGGRTTVEAPSESVFGADVAVENAYGAAETKTRDGRATEVSAVHKHSERDGHSSAPFYKPNGFGPGFIQNHNTPGEMLLRDLEIEKTRIRENLLVADNAHGQVMEAGCRIEKLLERQMALLRGNHFSPELIDEKGESLY